MRYKTLYHILNQRRKIELENAEKSVKAIGLLYVKILASNRNPEQTNLNEIQLLCEKAVREVVSTHEELKATDIEIENVYVEMERNNNPIIYSFDALKKKKNDNT